MSDDQMRDDEMPGLSRRSFMYGSVAVAGGAALLGRVRLPRRSATAAATPATLVQASGEEHDTGSVTLPLPKGPSSTDTLLVATVLSPAADTPFVPPAGSAGAGWQLGKAVTCPGGRIEQWYWANNPGGLYGPGAGAVFTGAAGQSCLGGIAEFRFPAGTTQILDTIGNNHGGGAATSMPVTTAGGVFAGTLGVFSQAEFFGASVPTGAWTLPAGYSFLANLHNGLPAAWSHSFDASLSAGNQSPSGGFSYTTGSNGWAAAACCYRAVTVAPIGVVGGEVTNCLDLDPTGQQLVVGGDVEGCWRTANFGDNWQPADYGAILSTSDQISFADIKWSLLEAGVVYACIGKTGTGVGAFIVSTDGGCTWSQRNSTTLMFYGNGTPNPPRPQNEGQDTDRTVNRLIAQDAAGGYLYLVTANSGVMRSGPTNVGVTWAAMGPSLSGAFYPRCIAINPANAQELWVGAWETDSSNGGVWHTTNARSSSPTWTRLAGFTGTVADLKVIGSGSSAYLYAACGTGGIYRAPVSGGALASLNGVLLNGTKPVHGGPSMNAIDATGSSIWVTLDGYANSSGHQVIVGCSGGVKVATNFTNVVQITVPASGVPAFSDLTGPNPITLATLPPFGKAWWHAGASWQLWLGGNNSVNPHILIDPGNRQNIYVTGGGGFFRSEDGGGSWQIAVNGMPMIGMHCFAIDPNDGTHFVHCGDDYTSIDVQGDPSGNTPADIVSTAPGASLSGSHRESHAVAFDPVDSRVYVGLNTAYSQSDGGAVMYRASAANSAWTSTGYDTQVSGAPAVIGLLAARDASGHRFVVAVAQGQGMYRWDGTNWAKCTENDTAPLPGSGGTVGQHLSIVSGNSPAYLYCFDRKQGLYRSADYGQSWTQIWTVTTADTRTGWLAVNPAVNGELWVSTDANLYKLSGAGGGTVGGGQITVTTIGGVFSAGAGGVAFAPSGDVYAIALPGSSPAPPVTTLYFSSNGGPWTDRCNGDASAGSYGPPSGQLGISSSGWLWVTSGEHFGYWDLITS